MKASRLFTHTHKRTMIYTMGPLIVHIVPERVHAVFAPNSLPRRPQTAVQYYRWWYFQIIQIGIWFAQRVHSISRPHISHHHRTLLWLCNSQDTKCHNITLYKRLTVISRVLALSLSRPPACRTLRGPYLPLIIRTNGTPTTGTLKYVIFTHKPCAYHYIRTLHIS